MVVVTGEFNEVREVSESFGLVFHQRQVDVFNGFIIDADLTEIDLGSYSFMWTNRWASEISKLDRFLVFESVLDHFIGVSVVILDK